MLVQLPATLFSQGDASRTAEMNRGAGTMKRLLLGGLTVLSLTIAAEAARADCRFNLSCGFNLSVEHTSKSRCFTYTSHANPLPNTCISNCTTASSGYGGCCGPAMWDGYHPEPAYPHGPAYGAPGHAAAYAPGAAAPAPAPATSPTFTPPQPTPANAAPKTSIGANGMQQAGYYNYPQNGNGGYNSNYGYNYSGFYGYTYGGGAGYFQAPSYWYGN
jgi:hypothetical protein